ncbi:MAG: hypothetical protein ACXVZX_10705 [Terriglobales bacterium]
MNVSTHRKQFILLMAAVLVIAISLFLYIERADHCMLYCYGASPEEVPQGTAIALLNRFRNRKDETNAEWLIRDLRTARCAEIVHERLGTEPIRICPVMRDNTKASLIWLDQEGDTTRGGTRKLIYDLLEKKARLVVYFGTDEAGWGVSTVSVLR